MIHRKKYKSKRLHKTKGGGVRLTSGELVNKKILSSFKRAVRNANAARRYQISKLPKNQQADYRTNKNEFNSFIYRKRSAKITNFKTKSSMLNYIKNIERMSKTTYKKKISNIYRDNYYRSLDRVFDSRGDELKAKLDKLSNKTFVNTQLMGQIEDIGYVYNDPASINEKINTLSHQIDKLIRMQK